DKKAISEREDLIWESFKAGNQSSLTYIFREYSNFLFNYGCQFTSDRNLVKDCLQDLFVDLIKHRKNLKATTSIKYYLMKSFRNKLAATVSKNKKREQAEQKKEGDKLFLFSISAEVKMINGQLGREKQKLIEKKLNELPDLQREALLLYFYEGLKYHQIADLLGIKVKSSRALIYRSLESLKDLLSPYKDIILFFLLSLHLLF
ncbi:unnamed protein product, partial [Chrysoparadoxa australica]